MRVLVLSCNTGEGHNAAGKAVVEAVRAAGHKAEMLDIMLLSGKRTSRMVGGIYVGIVKHIPRFFIFCTKSQVKSALQRESPRFIMRIR